MHHTGGGNSNGHGGNGGRAAAAAGGGGGGGGGSAGGVNRVAGSLMVTRALGDAYLKRPSLSFQPYKCVRAFSRCLPSLERHQPIRPL
jgi:hypothetical protein